MKNQKQLLKGRWKQYISEHPEWTKKIGKHHYIRSRFASKFWLKEIENIINK